MDIWIVLTEDRHADVDAAPFSTEDGAVAAAWTAARENALSSDEVGQAELTQGMLLSGWILYLPYGTEGDCVRVVKRQMDEP